MVVNVEQIKDTGLTLDEQVSAEALASALEGKELPVHPDQPPRAKAKKKKAAGLDTGFRATGPSLLHATLKKVSGGVLLDGKLVAHVSTPCKRCLVDVKLDVPIQFSLQLVAKQPDIGGGKDDEEGEGADGGEEEGSFDLESADQEAFNGKTIDLDPIVREQVLLALPMDAVCREDCKGLCPMCGTNRNEKQCSCEEKRIDPRLAALKDIKLN